MSWWFDPVCELHGASPHWYNTGPAEHHLQCGPLRCINTLWPKSLMMEAAADQYQHALWGKITVFMNVVWWTEESSAGQNSFSITTHLSHSVLCWWHQQAGRSRPSFMLRRSSLPQQAVITSAQCLNSQPHPQSPESTNFTKPSDTENHVRKLTRSHRGGRTGSRGHVYRTQQHFTSTENLIQMII